MRGSRTLALLAGGGAIALLPLFGDPAPASAVSHAEWARMVLRGLELLSPAAGVNDTAQQAFATLAGRDSRSLGAEQYVRGTRVELLENAGVARLHAVGGIGEAVFALGVASAGDYRMRVRLASPSTAEAELTRAGEDTVLRRLSLAAGASARWSEAGVLPLTAGAYEATVLLPEGGSLERVEIAPPCVHPIEPRGGWRTAALASVDDVAETVLQALDLESELPPAASALEFTETDLALEDGSRFVAAAGSAPGFRSGTHGARVRLVVDVPESGLYTLSALGVAAGGQRWIVDGCRSCLVCPSSDAAPRWQTILSGRLSRGRHLFAVSLGPQTLVERLRLEQKKDSAADYVATLARLGLELGPAGAIARERAELARRFLERQRAAMAVASCDTLLRPGALVADTAAGGPAAGGGGATPAGGSPPGGNSGGGGPVPPPVVPPLPPGSPTLPDRFATN